MDQPTRIDLGSPTLYQIEARVLRLYGSNGGSASEWRISKEDLTLVAKHLGQKNENVRIILEIFE